MADKKEKNPKIEEKSTSDEWSKTKGLSLEEKYPGVTEMIEHYKEAKNPACPLCGSENTASMEAGILGYAINIAESMIKFQLVANSWDGMGKYFCNSCGKYFGKYFD